MTICVPLGFPWFSLRSTSSASSDQRVRIERIVARKKLFFLLLFVSSVLDLPLYIHCIIKVINSIAVWLLLCSQFFVRLLSQGGPDYCEWDSTSYSIAWLLHLLALCGYCITVSIPPIMWAEIIQQRWTMSSSKFSTTSRSYDGAKYLIVGSILGYVLVQVATVLGLVFQPAITRPQLFLNTHFDTVCFLLESLFILVQVTTWLYVGLSLQLYVIGVRFDRRSQG